MLERKCQYHVEDEIFFITLWGDGETLHAVYVQEMVIDANGLEIHKTSESAKARLEAKVPGFAEHLWLLETTLDEIEAEKVEELAFRNALPSSAQPIDAFKQKLALDGV